jgi:hypothetical protein
MPRFRCVSLKTLSISAVVGLACLQASAGRSRAAESAGAAKSAGDAPAPTSGTAPATQHPARALLVETRVPFERIEASLPVDDRRLLITVTDRPGLHVMQTRSLAEQGRMFARIVALFERRDMPHDRVTSVASLATRARRSGDDPGTLTAGNNFSAIELARFFDTGRRQHIAFTPAEQELLDTLVAWGLLRNDGGAWHAVNPGDFLITLPGLGGTGSETIDAPLRAAILDHELGHWRYSSDAPYAQACREFWWHDLALQERVALTKQLTRLGYDARDEIVIDELQAYLLHTPEKYQPFADVRGASRVSIGQIRERLRAKTMSAAAARGK